MYLFKSKLKQVMLAYAAERGTHMSQRELAAVTGKAYSTVTRWYNDNIGAAASLEKETLGSFCKALGCSVGDLIDVVEVEEGGLP